MMVSIIVGNISGAVSCFSITSADDYEQGLLSSGLARTISALEEIGPLTPVYIENDAAEYCFDQTIDNQTVTFPVEFVKENGLWKILEF